MLPFFINPLLSGIEWILTVNLILFELVKAYFFYGKGSYRYKYLEYLNMFSTVIFVQEGSATININVYT